MSENVLLDRNGIPCPWVEDCHPLVGVSGYRVLGEIPDEIPNKHLYRWMLFTRGNGLPIEYLCCDSSGLWWIWEDSRYVIYDRFSKEETERLCESSQRRLEILIEKCERETRMNLIRCATHAEHIKRIEEETELIKERRRRRRRRRHGVVKAKNRGDQMCLYPLTYTLIIHQIPF